MSRLLETKTDLDDVEVNDDNYQELMDKFKVLEFKNQNMDNIVRAMSDVINIDDYESMKLFIDKWNKEHRYIQNQFMRWMATYMLSVAQTEYFDLRNEGAVMFARSIKDKLERFCL